MPQPTYPRSIALSEELEQAWQAKQTAEPGLSFSAYVKALMSHDLGLSQSDQEMPCVKNA